MKGRKILNGIFVLVLILAVMGLPNKVFASVPPPSIKILKVKTLNANRQLQSQFSLCDSILFVIKYEITGENVRYRVNGIVRLFGERIVVRQTRRPGIYRMGTVLIAPGRAVPGNKTVGYKVKLIKAGGVLDTDTATSQVTIQPCNPNLGYLRLVEKNPNDWSVVAGGARGLLRYTKTGVRFAFQFNAHGLSPNTSYTLIYYPDPWPGDGLICLARATTNCRGHIHMVGAANIRNGLPAEDDDNYPDGAKIWLVLTDDVNCSGKTMIDWDTGEYLFEDNLITYEKN